MSLSISDFSDVSGLSAQTLRYYHAEGLLVPAEVDERTGYRFYAFEQVERAALVGALRRAGLSVREVRAALAAPDAARELLQEHRDVLARRRAREDAALQEAWTLVTDWPGTRQEQAPAMTVVSVQVPARQRERCEEQVLPEHVRAAARLLATSVGEGGADVLDGPWAAHLLETPQQKARLSSPEGPDWEVAVAVSAVEGGAVPEGARVSRRPARQEVSLRVPTGSSIAAHAAAVHRILRHCLERHLVPDLAQPRHVLQEDHERIAVGVRAHGTDLEEDGPAGT